MEKNGFIYRESVEKDARLKRIVPTKKAEALRPSILSHINESEAQMTQGISKKDVAVCQQVLLQMLQNLSENKLKNKGESNHEQNTVKVRAWI